MRGTIRSNIHYLCAEATAVRKPLLRITNASAAGLKDADGVRRAVKSGVCASWGSLRCRSKQIAHYDDDVSDPFLVITGIREGASDGRIEASTLSYTVQDSLNPIWTNFEAILGVDVSLRVSARASEK